MSILGRALARLARQCGGQLLLELPDDLAPDVVAQMVRSANEEAGEAEFVLFANDRRGDADSIEPRVSYRELAAYRQGNHLAVAYASDNRGMHTYTSVYPNLLAPGFPDEAEETVLNGVGSLHALAVQAAIVIAERHRLNPAQKMELAGTLPHVAKFLADAYLAAGNGQTSLAADWWVHANEWLASLDEWLSSNASDHLAEVSFGSAGIPLGAGRDDGITPREFVRVLTERWSSAESVRMELARLSGEPSAKEPAELLEQLPWEGGMPKVSMRTDSAIARVAMTGVVDLASRAKRTKAWSRLDGLVFKNVYVDAKNKLALWIQGTEAPKPWSGGAAVIALPAAAGGSDGWLDLGVVDLVIPWKSTVPQDGLPARLQDEIEVQGGRKCAAKFEGTACSLHPAGLKVTGRLSLKPWAKALHAASIVVSAKPKASALVVDQCSADFNLVRHDEALLLLRRSEGAGSGRKSVLGPYIWREGSDVPTAVPLLSSGKYSAAVVAGSSVGAASEVIKSRSGIVNDPWPCDVLAGKYALGDLQLEDGDEIGASQPIFAVEVHEQENALHLSPVISAAFAQQPDIERQVPEGTLAWLDSVITEQLGNAKPGEALGPILLRSGLRSADLERDDLGCLVERDLKGRLGVLTPGSPSLALVSNAHYKALASAYANLAISQRIELLQQGKNVSSLTISRLSLEFVSQEQVDALLRAYLDLVEASNAFGNPADQFWAKHPFSVVIYPEEIGVQSASAILVSPLHPLRFAWLWMVQQGLRAAADDGLPPETSLELLDSTAYPAHLSVADPLGPPGHYIPLPIEPTPDGLFMGWQALVKFTSGEARVPDAIAGRPFPVEGLSSISPGAVSSALDDFLRVSPHVQALRIGLESTMATRRSQALDTGVLDKIASLARQSSGPESVGGVSVIDSTNRKGQVPSFRVLEEPLKRARPGFNVSWTSSSPGSSSPVHVSFLEGTAARLALSDAQGSRRGWLPSIPLRRFPRRLRPMPGIADLDFSLPSLSQASSYFQNALAAYEAGPNGSALTLRVMPNLAALPSRPNWLVAGDFGADPQAMADAASLGTGQDYMLWDWRPVSTVQSKNSPVKGRVQPYFVMATVPRALSTAIADRIGKLRQGLSSDELAQRTRKLVSVLAKRAIGLNTLLAVGHHQATGALGFYFALESLSRWVAAAEANETRIIIPVDAVDPYLRNLPGGGGKSRRRADLIAITIVRDAAEAVKVKLVPIEIKHYGLKSQAGGAFPASGDPSLQDHIEQLGDYQKQLLSLAANYMGGASSTASIYGLRLAIVLEAGIQLCLLAPGDKAGEMLSAIAGGKASIDVGKGVLLWYQAGASAPDGRKAIWQDVPGRDEDRRVEVRVDPAAFDDCYWSGEPGEVHQVVSDALSCAFQVSALMDSGSGGCSDGGLSVEDQSTHAASSANEDEEANPVAEATPAAAQTPQMAGAEALPIGTAKDRSLLTSEELERRYAQILGSLEEFNVKARRPKSEELPYTEGPAFVEYAIEPAYGVSVSKIESQLDNLKLRLKLPSDAQIGCATHLGNVLLSVPKHDKDRYFIDAEDIWSRWERPIDGFRIPLGEDTRGNIVEIDLSSSNSPHVLLAGVTGSGKSEALLTMLHGAVRYYSEQELRLALIDPKRTELVSLEPVPQRMGEIGASAEDAVALLATAVDEMERRYEEFRKAKVRDVQEYQRKVGELPRWLLVLDEYADLTSDEDERKEIEKYLKRLAQKARAAGIHLIVSTQKPVVSVINTVVKGNLPGRIALRVSTAAESKVILDETGAEQLVGKGDALMKVGAKKIRLQFAKVVFS